jgi:hypothetical protein
MTSSGFLTTAGGALTAIIGVLVGGIMTRRAQDRHWLRDRQLAAYQDLFGHYARFMMTISRAHAGRIGWDYDWGAWSASLITASLLAPPAVARRIDEFGRGIQVFLDATSARNSITDPASRSELVRAAAPAAAAQLELVNAIRASLGRRGALSEPLGGALGRDPDPDLP